MAPTSETRAATPSDALPSRDNAAPPPDEHGSSALPSPAPSPTPVDGAVMHAHGNTVTMNVGTQLNFKISSQMGDAPTAAAPSPEPTHEDANAPTSAPRPNEAPAAAHQTGPQRKQNMPSTQPGSSSLPPTSGPAAAIAPPTSGKAAAPNEAPTPHAFANLPHEEREIIEEIIKSTAPPLAPLTGSASDAVAEALATALESGDHDDRATFLCDVLEDEPGRDARLATFATDWIINQSQRNRSIAEQIAIAEKSPIEDLPQPFFLYALTESVTRLPNFTQCFGEDGGVRKGREAGLRLRLRRWILAAHETIQDRILETLDDPALPHNERLVSVGRALEASPATSTQGAATSNETDPSTVRDNRPPASSAFPHLSSPHAQVTPMDVHPTAALPASSPLENATTHQMPHLDAAAMAAAAAAAIGATPIENVDPDKMRRSILLEQSKHFGLTSIPKAHPPQQLSDIVRRLQLSPPHLNFDLTHVWYIPNFKPRTIHRLLLTFATRDLRNGVINSLQQYSYSRMPDLSRIHDKRANIYVAREPRMPASLHLTIPPEGSSQKFTVLSLIPAEKYAERDAARAEAASAEIADSEREVRAREQRQAATASPLTGKWASSPPMLPSKPTPPPPRSPQDWLNSYTLANPIMLTYSFSEDFVDNECFPKLSEAAIKEMLDPIEVLKCTQRPGAFTSPSSMLSTAVFSTESIGLSPAIIPPQAAGAEFAVIKNEIPQHPTVCLGPDGNLIKHDIRMLHIQDGQVAVMIRLLGHAMQLPPALLRQGAIIRRGETLPGNLTLATWESTTDIADRLEAWGNSPFTDFVSYAGDTSTLSEKDERAFADASRTLVTLKAQLTPLPESTPPPSQPSSFAPPASSKALSPQWSTTALTHATKQGSGRGSGPPYMNSMTGKGASGDGRVISSGDAHSGAARGRERDSDLGRGGKGYRGGKGRDNRRRAGPPDRFSRLSGDHRSRSDNSEDERHSPLEQHVDKLRLLTDMQRYGFQVSSLDEAAKYLDRSHTNPSSTSAYGHEHPASMYSPDPSSPGREGPPRQ